MILIQTLLYVDVPVLVGCERLCEALFPFWRAVRFQRSRTPAAESTRQVSVGYDRYNVLREGYARIRGPKILNLRCYLAFLSV
jgi:hypothetical protein